MAIVDDGPSISIAAGIVVGLFASFVQSLGLTIQRKSHVLNARLPEAEQRVEHRRSLWLLGFVIFITSNVFGSLFQIASLPVVILAPLGAVSLLWNAFFARLILGDVFSPWMIVGTLLIAGGAVLIGIFGTLPEPTRSLKELLALFSRPTFIIYFSLLGAAIVLILVLTHVLELSLATWLRKAAAIDISPPMSPNSFNPPVSAVPDTERTPLLDRKPPARTSRPSTPISHHNTQLTANVNRTRLFLAVSYASVSGILSGMCLLFAKSGVQLLVLTIGGNNQFWQWQAWMLLLGLVALALLQLWYLHKSLTLADPTLVCPLAFCFYNMSSIVNGLVYFNQLAELKPLHLTLMIVGMLILLGGVWAISFPSEAEGGGVELGAFQEPADSIGEGDTTSDANTAVPTTEPIEDSGLAYAAPTLPQHGRSRTADSLASWHGHDLHSQGSPSEPPADSGRTRRTSDREFRRMSPLLSPTRWNRPFVRRRFFSVAEVDEEQGVLVDASHLLPGGGLSVGLSPISPGFSIVPRRRVNTISLSGEDLLRSRMRRTVSENDVVAGASVPASEVEPQAGPSRTPAEAREGDDDSRLGRGAEGQLKGLKALLSLRWLKR